MLSDALAYPRRGEGVGKRHAIGGALLLLSVFFVPILFVYGYLVRVVRGVADGESEPPAWTDWEELLVDGVKYFVLSLAYGIPAAVLGSLIGVFTVGLAVGLVAESPRITLAFALIVGSLGLLTGLVALLAGYLLPGAVVNFVLEDDLAAAFHLRTIASNAFSWPYFAAWVKAIAVGFVLSLVASVLLFVFLLGLLVFFYLAVVATYLLTEGYLEAAGREPGAPANVA